MCESVVVIVWTIGRKFFASRFQLIIHSGCISRRSDTGGRYSDYFPFSSSYSFLTKVKDGLVYAGTSACWLLFCYAKNVSGGRLELCG